jgi:Spy/CpxP family protein refolding chaperone
MERGLPMGQHHGEMMESNFFPPDLVMHHQKDLALTAEQQTTLREEAVKFAAHETDLRWQLCAEEEALAAMLKEAKPDEKAVLAQQEKLLKLENDLKLSRLGMLIRVKNALTADQQHKLAEMKEHMEHNMWGGRMMGRGGMGFHPGFGRGPGMGGGFEGGMRMHGEGMGMPGGQPPANPPPPPPPSEAK